MFTSKNYQLTEIRTDRQLEQHNTIAFGLSRAINLLYLQGMAQITLSKLSKHLLFCEEFGYFNKDNLDALNMIATISYFAIPFSKLLLSTADASEKHLHV